jgi:hypothetical protein
MPGVIQKGRLWVRRCVRFALRLLLRAAFVGQRRLTYAAESGLGPLQKETQQIRLLRPVRHGALSLGVLRFALEVVDIKDEPDFVALSYTWGPADADDKDRNAVSERMPIYINSRRLDVYPNLFDALTQLVRSGFDRCIWIDAICINQEDVDEATQQVQMMDTIYKSASSTVLWLGRESGRTARAAAVLAQCASIARDATMKLLDSPTWAEPISPYDPRPLDKYGMPLLVRKDWQALTDIYGRRYFGRAWMAQEVALSRHLQVRIGNTVLDWNDLGTFAVFLLLSNALSTLQQFPGVIPGSDQLVRGAMCVFRLHITRLWCRTTDDPELARRLERFTALEREPKSFGLGLLELLVATPCVAATDLRDIIFSKYGIMKHLAPKLDDRSYLPEYRTTVPEVFFQTSTKMIEETGDLRILTLVGDGYGETVDSTKPSWVPEFDGSWTRPGAMLAFASWSPTALKFNASGSATDQHRATVDGNTLRVYAVEVGRVVACGNTMADMITQYLFAETAKMLLHHCTPVHRHTGQSRTEAFWRSLVIDQDMTSRPAGADLGESFRIWFCLLLMLRIRALLKKGATISEVEKAYEEIDRIASEESPAAQFFPRWTETLERLVQAGWIVAPKGSGLLRASDTKGLLRGWVETTRKFENVVYSIMSFRLPFAIDNGRVAFGPIKAAVGDSVWIVAGCPVPLLLRRSGDDQLYRIVGETYVHGIMTGEAVSGEVEWKRVCLA